MFGIFDPLSMSARPKADPRIERTRARLRAALIELMQERPYDAVTVQDVLDRANVGRTTFYAHYTSKDAVLEDGLQHLGRALRARAATCLPGPLSWSLAMFEHVEEHRRLNRALVGRRSHALVQQKIRAIVTAIAREELAPQASAIDVPMEMLVEHVVGSFLSVMTWWLDHRTGLEPAQIDAVFRSLTLPVIESARRRRSA